LSVLEGGIRRSLVLRKALAPVVCGLLMGVAGCGGGEGVSKDATVTAYVEAPLCAGAKQELSKQGNRAGELRVQAICLPTPRSQGKLQLSTLGANAREATEDSTTVAYLEASDPRAFRFTHPILETAEIPWISGSSGKAAMARLLELIEASGSGSLRASIREALRET
jgi:hypothetical protein